MDTRKVASVILNVLSGLCIAVMIAAVVIFFIRFPSLSSGENTADANKVPVSTQVATTPQIQYEQVDLQTMLDDLKANAMRAEEEYQNKYIEITGEIRNFDSDGKYISIAPCGAPKRTLDTVLCRLMDSAQKAFLLEKSVGDVITIRGKVTTIGEIIGYQVKIAEIID